MTLAYSSLIGNVAEAGDIVVLAILLGTTLIVGLTLVGVDVAVGRLRDRRTRHRASPVTPKPHVGR